MSPEEALEQLAAAAELANVQPPPQETGASALRLALAASGARSAFLARVEGAGLRLHAGLDRDGQRVDVPRRALDLVAAAVQEAQDGVRDAPPSMTGGRAPRGAVAVKAEAGHPPVHAFPLLDPDSGSWLGVLGLHPDPTAPPDPDPTADRTLLVLVGLLGARVLRGAPQGRERDGEGAGEFRYDYGGIVTRSPKMFAIFRKLDRIIGADVPVLINGETGTGKELVAKALHRNDPKRRSKRFYAQNCAAISETLLESELFGHEKGAFTGAEQRKKGLFEIASESTLFLDEIGDMSLDMQAKLLRVLQEKEVVPLGATAPVKVDVRLVAATHRDLEADVAAGRFRSDLYYRLKVVRLNLPPLRERPEDIPTLVDHFLREVARDRGERAKVLDRRDERVVEALGRYAWPGNIRELQNTIHRLAYLSPGNVITYEALAEERHLVGADATDGARPVRPLDEVVEEVERSEIDNALRQTGGNRTQAAALLKINRRSLLRRLQKYGYQNGEEE